MKCCRAVADGLPTEEYAPTTGLTHTVKVEPQRPALPGPSRRLSHEPAIHSGSDRSRAHNHGQPHGCLDLSGSLSSQVTILLDLARKQMVRLGSLSLKLPPFRNQRLGDPGLPTWRGSCCAQPSRPASSSKRSAKTRVGWAAGGQQITPGNLGKVSGRC